MNDLVPFLSKIDWPTLLAIGAMLYLFYNRLDAKIDKVQSSTDLKIDKLSDKVEDIDRRLCRIEGAISAKDCCVLTAERNQKQTG